MILSLQNMKQYLFIIAISILPYTLIAQEPDGAYLNEQDSIVFSDNRLIFRISGFAGLSAAQVGEGEYQIIDNYILIHTADYSGNKSSFQELDGTREDTCVVKLVSVQNYPIQGILVESKNKSDKTINAQVTGNDGMLYFTDLSKTARINASSLGYNSIEFDYNAGKDYVVRIAENDVIEDKTVVLKLENIDDESITVLMLSDDFDSSKNVSKELNKLEKRSKRRNVLPKLLSKEDVPFKR